MNLQLDSPVPHLRTLLLLLSLPWNTNFDASVFSTFGIRGLSEEYKSLRADSREEFSTLVKFSMKQIIVGLFVPLRGHTQGTPLQQNFIN